MTNITCTLTALKRRDPLRTVRVQDYFHLYLPVTGPGYELVSPVNVGYSLWLVTPWRSGDSAKQPLNDAFLTTTFTKRLQHS